MQSQRTPRVLQSLQVLQRFKRIATVAALAVALLAMSSFRTGQSWGGLGQVLLDAMLVHRAVLLRVPAQNVQKAPSAARLWRVALFIPYAADLRAPGSLHGSSISRALLLAGHC